MVKPATRDGGRGVSAGLQSEAQVRNAFAMARQFSDAVLVEAFVQGNDYRVVGLARSSETLEEFVVYEALYGPGGLWVRPRAMFTETVEVGGKRVPRFARVGD